MNYQNSISEEKINRLLEQKKSFKLGGFKIFGDAFDVMSKNSDILAGFSIIFLVLLYIITIIDYVNFIFIDFWINCFYAGIGIFIYHKHILNLPKTGFSTFLLVRKHALKLFLFSILLMVFRIILLGINTSITEWLSSLSFNNGSVIIGVLLEISELLNFLLLFLLNMMYIFTPFLIVFGNMNIWKAMEASRKMVFNNFFNLTIFYLISYLILVLGMVLCCLGLIWATPCVAIAHFMAFDIAFEFTKNTDEADELDKIIDHLI